MLAPGPGEYESKVKVGWQEGIDQLMLTTTSDLCPYRIIGIAKITDSLSNGFGASTGMKNISNCSMSH
ncbi:uncharacterized protein N7529_003266 [Penicillium soppii]|uniref:uncharacterized protein n=1 Tax=Penicillium soppii TaxID=69789 RepID=UPI00254903FE|nr:uncharacterized protein N7529_003266 [Penicillium soppii]KAJ5874836.1 hypothetical protein N7529_003266 [Penicillium soppii]